jgi:thymidine kinase
MKKIEQKGKLEVVCGSMFSGKTEELIRRVRRAHIAGLKVQVFKPEIDERGTPRAIHTHNGEQFAAQVLAHGERLFEAVASETQVVGIDEVQFFSSAVVPAIQHLLLLGVRVIVSGLDLDFRGIPFGCMPTLMALADSVTKLRAVCTECGDDAHFTQRLVNGQPASFKDPLILIGAQDYYQARCRACFCIRDAPSSWSFLQP